MPDASTTGFREQLLSVFDDPSPPDDSGFGWLWQTPEAHPRQITDAAVLVPLIDHPGGMTVLLTRRTRHLKSHAGQVSFPGGKIEPHDASAEAAALRETREEIGLASDRITILGRLGRRTTGTGFRVTPVVGIIQPPLDLRPDANEVETVFELPLSFLLDRRNHKTETRFQRGLERTFYVIPYQDYYIWGLTARLLVALTNRLKST